MKETKATMAIEAAALYFDAMAREQKARRDKESAKAVLIAKMDELCTDELKAGGYRVTRSTSMRNRFDTAAFKADHPDEHARYTVKGTVHHFSVDQ